MEALIFKGLRDALEVSFAEKEQAVASLVPLAMAMATLPRHSMFTEGSRRISSNHHMHWGRATRSLLSTSVRSSHRPEEERLDASSKACPGGGVTFSSQSIHKTEEL